MSGRFCYRLLIFNLNGQEVHRLYIASETDARKMQSFARLGGLKEAPASIGGEYFTQLTKK